MGDGSLNAAEEAAKLAFIELTKKVAQAERAAVLSTEAAEELRRRAKLAGTAWAAVAQAVEAAARDAVAVAAVADVEDGGPT